MTEKIMEKLIKGFDGSGHTECQMLVDMAKDIPGNNPEASAKEHLDHLDTMLLEVITNARAMRQELNSLRKCGSFLCPEEFSLNCVYNEGPPISGKIAINASGIFISFKDHGVASEDDGECVLIEQGKGEPRVIVWSDINVEDPTHTIELDGARHDKRVEL